MTTDEVEFAKERFSADGNGSEELGECVEKTESS